MKIYRIAFVWCASFVLLVMPGLGQAGNWEATGLRASDPPVRARTLFVTSDGTLFAATHTGLLRSTDRWDTWENVGPASVSALAESYDRTTLFISGKLGVHRSADGGDTWVELLPQPERDSCIDILQYQLVLATPGEDMLIASYEEDIGSSGCKMQGHIYRFGLDGTLKARDYSINYPATPRDGLYLGETLLMGDDGGRIFRLPPSEKGTFVTRFSDAVIALAYNGVQLFAATGTRIFPPSEAAPIPSHRVMKQFQSPSELYRSADGGYTWEAIDTGLEDLTIYDLAATPNGELFVGTRPYGVLYSSDNGATWKAINTGLPSLTLTALAISPDGYLYADIDQGIYRISLAQATAAENEAALPDGFALAQNYPNPFNPSTTIRYALPEATEVRLTVYDALGREVKRLVDGLQVAGEHEVVFEGQGLPSGVYVYRLTAGSVTQTRRMVLMK